MNEYFKAVWNNPEWKFRGPRSLAETKLIVELYLQIVTMLFRMSDYPAPYIGGPVQTCVVPQPENIASTC